MVSGVGISVWVRLTRQVMVSYSQQNNGRSQYHLLVAPVFWVMFALLSATAVVQASENTKGSALPGGSQKERPCCGRTLYFTGLFLLPEG